MTMSRNQCDAGTQRRHLVIGKGMTADVLETKTQQLLHVGVAMKKRKLRDHIDVATTSTTEATSQMLVGEDRQWMIVGIVPRKIAVVVHDARMIVVVEVIAIVEIVTFARG